MEYLAIVKNSGRRLYRGLLHPLGLAGIVD